MTRASGSLFDELGRFVSGAAGALDGARREVEEIVRARLERGLRDLDVPSREEFEALRDMARHTREENARLNARLVALEGGETVAAPLPDGDAAFGEAAGEAAVEAERAAPT